MEKRNEELFIFEAAASRYLESNKEDTKFRNNLLEFLGDISKHLNSVRERIKKEFKKINIKYAAVDKDKCILWEEETIIDDKGNSRVVKTDRVKISPENIIKRDEELESFYKDIMSEKYEFKEEKFEDIPDNIPQDILNSFKGIII